MTALAGRPRPPRGGWYRMPDNVRVRAIDVERALVGIGTPTREAMRYVQGKVSPLVAAEKTYVWYVAAT